MASSLFVYHSKWQFQSFRLFQYPYCYLLPMACCIRLRLSARLFLLMPLLGVFTRAPSNPTSMLLGLSGLPLPSTVDVESIDCRLDTLALRNSDMGASSGRGTPPWLDKLLLLPLSALVLPPTLSNLGVGLFVAGGCGTVFALPPLSKAKTFLFWWINHLLTSISLFISAFNYVLYAVRYLKHIVLR